MIPLIYDFIRPFQNGLAMAALNNRYVYIDKYGQIQLEPPVGYFIEDFISDDIVIAVIDNGLDSEYVLLSLEGKELSARYDRMEQGSGELIAALNSEDIRYGDREDKEDYSALIDKSGKEVRRFGAHEFLFPFQVPEFKGHFLKVDENNDDVGEIIDPEGNDTGLYIPFMMP